LSDVPEVFASRQTLHCCHVVDLSPSRTCWLCEK